MENDIRTKVNNMYDSAGSFRVEDIDDYTVCEYDLDSGRLKYQNGALLQRLGIALPDNMDDFGASVLHWPIPDNSVSAVVDNLTRMVSDRNHEGPRVGFEMTLSSADGDLQLDVSAIAMFGEKSHTLGMLFANINEEKRSLLELIDQAETDPLTGAFNRRALIRAVKGLISDKKPFAFVMMDVDGFKKFNDTFGHATGDNMLVDIVKRMRTGLRREDIIGRIGGDEFIVCLRNISEESAIERLARHICKMVQHSMANGMRVSASLGVATYPKDGCTFEELYEKSDIAMYRAKHDGGDCFVMYPPREVTVDTELPDSSDIASEQNSVIIRFNILDSSFEYPACMSALFAAKFDNRPLWQIMEEDWISSAETAIRIHNTIVDLSVTRAQTARFCEFFLHNKDGTWHWYRIGLLRCPQESFINITVTDINDEVVSRRRLSNIEEYDELTGLLARNAFIRTVSKILRNDPESRAAGEYAIVYFDIQRFKAINDMFGIDEGDRLLLYISDIIATAASGTGAASRIGSDRFALFVRSKGEKLEGIINRYLDALTDYDLPFEIVSNVGVYVITEDLPVDAMLDRAILAQGAIKGSYVLRYGYYTEELRSQLLSEHEIVGLMTTALVEGQFKVYLQPQYDYSNDSLVGAEALVRWQHPERGLIMPGMFIPIFEKNGFIAQLDLFVFEQVCRFQRACIGEGLNTVPISVNLTRYDIFQHDFLDNLESIRRRYDVPVELLRLEITETVIMGSNQYVSEIILKLHELGYVIEMDDFGSGYSSLNVLKDVELDILKLDMKFIDMEGADSVRTNRGGTILSSVIRMAKWLGLPVIAEGVENVQQAEYLQSIGCTYIQGYLYEKPIEQGSFKEKIRSGFVSSTAPQLRLIETLDAANFWDPKSQETLIFSNYVGGAEIFDYHDGKIEVLRVNGKFIKELGGGLNEKDIINNDPLLDFDEENKKIYLSMLDRAIESEDEEECETWRSYTGCKRCGVCVHSTVRLIGKSDNSYLFYESIRNITGEKEALAEVTHRETLFRAASEQANIYYWEYNVQTKEMLPCFRCMRDLGLPQLVRGYPEPAIDMGIIPSDYADKYREVHRRLAAGERTQELDIPLTPDRVMFRVRYTNTYDDNGKPLVAYGSATKI